MNKDFLASLIVIACTFIVIATIHYSSFERHHTHDWPHNHSDTYQTAIQNDVTDNAPVSINNVVESVAPTYKRKTVDAYTSERKLQHDDHKAQIFMATFAGLGLIIGGVGMILLGRTLFYTRKAAEAAADTLRIAEQGSIVQFRPTITLENSKITIMPQITRNGEIETKISLDIKNWGTTPVNYVRVDGRIIYEDCNGLVEKVPLKSGTRFSLFDATTGTIAPSQTKSITIELRDKSPFGNSFPNPQNFCITVDARIIFEDVYSRKYGRERSFKIFYSDWPWATRFFKNGFGTTPEDFTEIYYPKR